MFMNGSWESSFHWIEGMDFENLTRKGGVDVTPNLSMHPQFEKALKNSHTGEKSKKHWTSGMPHNIFTVPNCFLVFHDK